MTVGDRVKVIDQDIFGVVLAIHKDTNEVVIRDLDMDFDECDVLVYRPRELRRIEDE